MENKNNNKKKVVKNKKKSYKGKSNSNLDLYYNNNFKKGKKIQNNVKGKKKKNPKKTLEVEKNIDNAENILKNNSLITENYNIK